MYNIMYMLRSSTFSSGTLLHYHSTLDLQPNVCNLPAIGPALKIDTCLVKWEGLPDTQGDQPCGEPLEFRVLLEAGLGEMTTSHLQLENCGTTAIYYSWQVLGKRKVLGRR